MGAAYTPEQWDAWTARMKSEFNNGNGHGKSLNVEAQRLLPTPRASGGAKGGPNQRGSKGDLTMSSAVHLTDFGKYTPAIERWEKAAGRPAPDPTKPSPKTGKPQLSAEFVEWMMGLPAGWFTSPEIGLTRVQALKIGGNGVVPQQAEFAIRGLMGRIEVVS